MMDVPDLPAGLTYAALGAGILGIVLTMFWSYALRVRSRDATDRAIDDRAKDLIKTAIEPFQELIKSQNLILDEERKEKARAQDARDKAVESLVTFMQSSDQLHRQEIGKVRDDASAALQKVQDDAKETNQRLHDRVDACERSHEADRKAVAVVIDRIKQMEDRQYQTALAAPATVPIVGVTIPATPAQPPGSA